MQDSHADELWPFLLPVLERVFDLRNRYAHGTVVFRRDGSVEVTSWNRGKHSVRTYQPEGLGWLAWQTLVARVELARVWAYFAPHEPGWHEPPD
jgi:hypothetical protein